MKEDRKQKDREDGNIRTGSTHLHSHPAEIRAELWGGGCVLCKGLVLLQAGVGVGGRGWGERGGEGAGIHV